MSTNVNCGYIKIDKEVLKPLCEKCIKYIYDTRALKEELFVKAFIKKWNKKAQKRNKIPLIGKLFHIQELSDIQQTKRLMDRLYIKSEFCGAFQYDYSSDFGAYELRKIQDILECCNNKDINSEISLSVEIYRQILYGQK